MIQTVFPGSPHYKHKSNEQFTEAGFHTEFQDSEDFLTEKSGTIKSPGRCVHLTPLNNKYRGSTNSDLTSQF